MNSRAKYEELLQQDTFSQQSPQQRGLKTICEILQAASGADLVMELVNKAVEISNKSPELSPVVVFQIAGDEVKVDELCNKIKN